MRVLLCQIDGKLPNLALMRLAAYHRGLGDEVSLRHMPTRASAERGLFDAFGRVYASLIFERSRPVAERLRDVYPGAVIGGTGWDLSVTLEAVGVPAAVRPDYSDYPAFRPSMGFTQRGCRLACGFCVVPRKEGKVAAALTAAEIWRGPPHPRDLVLLDNDFFGNPAWRERVAEMRGGGYRVNLTQGVNCRTISEDAARALASLDYYDTGFRRRRLYTAWDSRPDETALFRGLSRLRDAGVPPSRVTVYKLIGYWPGETEADWLYRRDRLRDFGCDPYPMPYRRTPVAVGFQRWVVGHYDRRIPWEEFRAANCQPRRLKHRGRMPLPLFGEKP